MLPARGREALQGKGLNGCLTICSALCIDDAASSQQVYPATGQ